MDYQNKISVIDNLIKEGMEFNFNNFANIYSSAGYPKGFGPEFMSWVSTSREVLIGMFGESSQVFTTFNRVKEISLLGNGENEFKRAMGFALGGLMSAKKLLENKIGLESGISQEKNNAPKGNDIFVVHGHDELLKEKTENFIKGLGLNPIVLHKEVDNGNTVIEKFERCSKNASYAFVLLTPDDIGYPQSEEQKIEGERKKELRSRQNVIFEFGYFIGLLGRNRVCCLYKDGTTIPTDIDGLVYKKISNNDIESQGYSIIKELKSAGFEIKL